MFETFLLVQSTLNASKHADSNVKDSNVKELRGSPPYELRSPTPIQNLWKYANLLGFNKTNLLQKIEWY